MQHDSFTTSIPGIMLLILLFLVRALAVGSSAIPAPTQAACQILDLSTESSSFNVLQPNATINAAATSVGDQIDDRLKPIYTIRPDVRLCGTSAYLTVLKAMMTLSSQPYLQRYPGGRFAYEDYNNLELLISSEGALLQYRHAILGLYRTIRTMTEKKRMNMLRATLYWVETAARAPQEVGTIDIFPKPLPSPLEGGTLYNPSNLTGGSISLTNDLGLSNLTTFSSNVSVASLPLQVKDYEVVYSFRETLLPATAMFMAACTAVVYVAPFSAFDTVQPFTSTNGVGGRTKISIEPYRAGQPQGYFQYHNVAMLMGEIAEHMLNERSFKELDFVFKIGGDPVGKGSIENVRTTSGVLEEA